MVGISPQPGWLRRILGYCWQHKTAVVLAVGGSVAVSVVASLTPLVVREVVDDVILEQHSPLAPWVLLLVCAAAARGLFAFVRRYFAGALGYRVDRALRNDLFDTVQYLDGAQQDKLKTGQLVSRATSDVTMVERLLSMAPLVVASMLQFVLSLIIMAVLSPVLTVVALLMAPCLLFVARRGMKVFFPATWEQSQRQGEVAGIVEAAVAGVRVVKGFGQEQREQERLESSATTLFGAGMRVNRLVVTFMPLFRGIPAFGQIGVLALGGWLALNGDITLGTFLAFATYLAQMIGPLMMFTGQLTQAQTTKAAIVRIFEVIDASPELTDKPDAIDAPTGAEPIELREVTFGYEADNPVLRNVSLRVEPGETLALVGGAGSGKSTIAQLLPRFYDPQSGSVRLGAYDLRDLSTASLRSRIGMVFEDSFLFSDTVHANIAFGRPDATEDDVLAAARAAEADRFISELDEGYQTVVGERGLTLSGGQRQRIALARAILTDPRLLVLDDATSAIDAGVEAEIHATLRKVMRGRTTVLIAHRRSTLLLADRIAVLHRGEVVSVGTHEELMATCPRYRLLLTGHDEEIDGFDVPDDFVEAARTTAADGVTPELWNNPPDEESTGTGALGKAGLPPDQAAKVAALPPANDRPAIDVALSRRPDPEFGLRRLWQPFRRGIVVGISLVALSAIAQLAVPWLTRLGIDEGVTRNAPDVLFAMCGIAFVVVVFEFFVNRAQARVVGGTGERILYWLRVKLYAHLQRLGMDFYERERGGQVMTRMTSDIESVKAFIQGSLGQFVVAVLSFFGVLGVMFAINVQLTLATMTLLPPFVVAVLLYRRFSTKAYEASRDQLSVVNANFQENISGIRVAQAYGREARNIEIFHGLTGELYSRQMRAQVYLGLFFSFVELANEVAIAVVLGVSAGLVAGGDLTAGGVIAFMLYITMLFSPLQQMSHVLDSYQRAKIGLGRIRELLRTPTSTPAAADPQPVERVSGRIHFDNVRFSYVTAPAVPSESDEPTNKPNGRASDATNGTAKSPSPTSESSPTSSTRAASPTSAANTTSSSSDTGSSNDGGATSTSGSADGADSAVDGEVELVTALRDVNLRIEPGETVAIVGETGAGKSTMVKLVARFYDPTEGAVRIDEADLRDLDLEAYRHRLGVVPQEAYLFSGSVRDAIAYGRPDADDVEVEQAAREVGAHEMITTLRHGYLHPVGERGRGLSAGQRQLLALARAQLVDPDILLLDEATASLDLATEAAVAKATDRLTNRRTTLVIAHRLTTAEAADRIIVVDGGEIVENGTHDELLAAGGRYAELWDAFVGHEPAATASIT